LLHQRYKDLCFLLIEKATWPNYWILRWRNSLRKPHHPIHLHLGCGPKYMPGFVNIDANPFTKTDMWLDVRCGIPFADQAVDSVYATHMFEHFYPDELGRLLCECKRVLKPGGGMRVIVPSLHSAIAAYQQGRKEWFDDFPRKFDSVGGRFSNFIFCDGQHRAGLDFSYLREAMQQAGFQEIEESAEGTSRLYGSNVPPYTPGDSRDLPHSLYVEAFK
jgi:predicted SAM-dependent methyltransferase